MTKKGYPHPIWYNSEYRKVENEVSEDFESGDEMDDPKKVLEDSDEGSEYSSENETEK